MRQVEVLQLGKLGEDLRQCCQKNQNVIECYMEREREFGTDWRHSGEQIKMGEECGTRGTEKECVLVERYGCKKPLERPRCRWDANTETGFQDRMSGHRPDSAG
jgi:hypothetical protein